MAITNVAWSLDHQQRPVLTLDLDGHPAYIHSCQKTALLDRGILKGMVFLASERGAQLPSPFVQGDFGSELGPTDLIGCTDDAAVFGLYQEMCAAILLDTWRVGPPHSAPNVRA